MSATQSIVSQYEDEYIYNADENNSTIKKILKNLKIKATTIKKSVTNNAKKLRNKLSLLNK